MQTQLTFETMVSRLFKVEGMHTQHEALMHAAIGIAGEVGEILEAIANGDIPNLNEEFGDSEFYQEAAWQAIDCIMVEPTEAWGEMMCLDAVGLGLAHSACKILDVAKRSWVYGEEVNKLAVKDALMRYREYHLRAIREAGMKLEDIRHKNMWKLVLGPNARFPDAAYTDQAAQERADKQ